MDGLTRRSFGIIAAAAAAAALAGCSSTFRGNVAGAPPSAGGGGGAGVDYDRVEFSTGNVRANFATLTGSPRTDPGHPEGAGGRMGVLTGPDGIFMVDASYAPLTDKVSAAIKSLSNEPFRYLVNTHEHPDHTGGNGNIVRRGALLIGRADIREELTRPLPAAVGSAASGTDPARLPSVTLGRTDPLTIRMNAETVNIIPFPDAHTKGDTVVQFENADTIMIGDFYRNYGYPFVDPTNGGTLPGVLDALTAISNISGQRTTLVPGHGSVIDRSAIVPYRDMINQVSADVGTLVGKGKTLPEVLAAKLTLRYDASVPGGLDPLPGGLGTSADRFVATLYIEMAKTG
jgi:cyclase